MKDYRALLFRSMFIAVAGICAIASAQSPANTSGRAAAQVHIAAARAAAYEPGSDYTALYDRVCGSALSEKGPGMPDPNSPTQNAPSLAQRKVPPRSQWYTEPAKVFDNLYYVGSKANSTWAVMTSDGIILIDSGMDYTAPELITDGLKKLGADPAQIKYVILSHSHQDRYGGSRYIQDTYHPHIILTDADWDAMAKSNEPNEVKPKRDMIATDGMKVTLGDTTLTLYITPGHTPATISTLVPLKDGNKRHVGAVWGGIEPAFERNGVQYFPSLQETFKTWSASAARFQGIAAKAGADVYLGIHPQYDKLLDKINALKFREPGGPHPFVSKNGVNRFLTVIKECADADFSLVTN